MSGAPGDARSKMGGISQDRLLGGQVIFRQPEEGYRAAIDPVLLAAAVPASAEDRVLELGAGAGAGFLCLLARCEGVEVTAIERDPALAQLARDNAADNGWGDQVEVLTDDLAHAPREAFDQVFFNPPFLEAARAMASDKVGRDSANVEGEADLAAWIRTGLAALTLKGRLTLIQRADRLGDILSVLAPGAGEVVVFPLWPKAGRAAKRVIVTARKGVRAPLRLASGLILHHEDGGFSAEAQSILSQGQALELARP